jgi:isopentenyl-diphosphate delta-isomerase type 1
VEIFDIVNEDGSSAGYQASRDDVHRKGLWHKTVHIWVMNRQGNLLLQKRALSKETFPGCWDISCAGHIDAGETPLEAAVRELKEELGFIVHDRDLVFLFSVIQKFTFEKTSVIDNEIVEVFLLHKDYSVNKIRYDKEEISDVIEIRPAQLIQEKQLNLPMITQRQIEYNKLLDYLSTIRTSERQLDSD